MRLVDTYLFTYPVLEPRKAMTPAEHDRYNAVHYPGTRQMCDKCDNPTGRCEDDEIRDDEGNVYCEECGDTVCYMCGKYVETQRESWDTDFLCPDCTGEQQ